MPNPNSTDYEQLVSQQLTAPAEQTTSVPDGTPTNNYQDKDDLLNFVTAKVRLERLITEFGIIQQRALTNRMERFKDINIKALQDKQELKPDQYLLPVRAIESNIRREQPAYINYLKQSRRLLIFRDIVEPLRVTTRLEDEFTRGMTYNGWETAPFKCVDGHQTHGWDAVEVVFDQSKPLHVGIEHIGNDRLIIPVDSQNIQDCEVILRLFTVTCKQLKDLVKNFEFSKEEVDKLLDKQAENKKEATIQIYKKFCKYEGAVFVSWFSLQCDEWLKPPAKMYIGRRQLQTRITTQMVSAFVGINPIDGSPIVTNQPQQVPTQEWINVDETMYPIFILPYGETEQVKIVSHKGRVFLDKPKQEAKTANLSQFLNGCQRASAIYPSMKPGMEKNAKELQSVKIGDGIIPPIPLEYNSPKYPDAVMLNLQQYFDSYDSQEAGQVNFAAINRKDSRKTATEISAATEEAAKLNSVQLALFSTFIREVYTFAWEIVKSRANQNKIVFLVNPETGENDIETLNRLYDIRAAGDIDVVKRAELIQQYKEFWPIVANTPLATTFLSRLLKLAFPDEGELYSSLVQQEDPRILIGQLVEVLKGSIDTAELQALDPQARQNLMMLIQKATMVSQQPDMENAKQSGSSNRTITPQQTSTASNS